MLLLMLWVPSLAQAQSRLLGKIKDHAGHPLDAATIILMQGDKKINKSFADLGNFTLNYTETGSYVVVATLVGFQPLRVTVQLPKDSLVLLMQPDSKQLKEVTITFERPLIERKVDRVTLNVEQSILASGGNAWEALTKAPGVQINSSNEVTANRKNVQVYLDGKPLSLSGDDLSAYLQGLPYDLISQIEVYSNPPAKFEAEGGSVINIITKKAKQQGFNVIVNSGFTQGIYSMYNGSTTFNYRKDKLNVFGNYGFAHRHSFQDNNVSIDYGNSFWSSYNRHIFESDNQNYRLGADYQLSENQVLGFLITGNNRNGTSKGQTLTKVTSPQMTLDSTLITDNTSTGCGNQFAYNINYNLKLDSGKRNLNIDIDYSPYQSSSDAFANNISFLPGGQQTSNQFHIYTPSAQHIDIYSGKADYEYHLFGKWDLISGVKYSRTQSRNENEYYNRDGSALTAVPENSNHFLYREKTAAVYTSISGSIGKWTLQAGLRGEFTKTRGYSITLDSLNERKYFKLFPTVFIQYKIDDDNQLQLNYAYRIERPEYNRINPAKRYTSPYNVYSGNPALQPAFVQNIELSYTYKQNNNLTAFYTATHDLFSNVNVQDNETKIYYGTHANLALSTSMGLRLSKVFHPTAWWELNMLASAYRQHDKSAYLTGSYDYHQFSYDATLQQSFTISAKAALKAELNGMLFGPSRQVIYQVDHYGQIDAGVKMDVLKGMGTIRLAVNDIFNTNAYNIKINYLDQRSSFFNHAESRTAALSFSYRLGKKIASSRSRSTASEEERRRAQ